MTLFYRFLLIALAALGGSVSTAQSPEIGMSKADSVKGEEFQPLSRSFFQRFRALKDLIPANINAYFSQHPGEIAAFERYILNLVDQSFMPEQQARGLIQMVQAHRQRPHNRTRIETQSPRRLPIEVAETPQRSVLESLEKKETSEGTAEELYFLEVVSALEPLTPPLSETESIQYQETRSLALQLSLPFSFDLLRSQKSRLSPTFAQTFRSAGEFASPEFMAYFERNPDEVWAGRRYIQRLVDLDILSVTQASDLVVTAFKGASKGAIGHGDAIGDAQKILAIKPSAKNIDLEIAGLPNGVRSQVATDYVLGNEEDQLIQFGEVPALPGAPNQSANNDAEKAIRVLEEQERRRKLAKTAAKIMRVFAENNVPRREIGARVAQIFKEEAEQKVETVATEEATAAVENIFDSGKASMRINEGSTEYSVSGLKAFESGSDASKFGFGQIGIQSDTEATTINIGVGIRALNSSNTAMAGTNAFYDHELNEGHRRIGVGVELISAPFMFSANRYYALSSGKQINSTTTETALDGRDVKFRGALPYLPGLFAEYKDFRWYAADGGADLFGQTFGLSGRLSENLSVDVGRTLYGSGQSGTNSAMLTYNYVNQKERSPRLFDFSPYPWIFQPIQAAERYRLVDRESKIVTQTSSSTSGLSITFSSI